MQNSKKGPQFVQYFEPVIAALKELGNSGTPAEVRDLIIQKLNISDDFIDGKLNSGASRFENQVAWARFYLVKAGYLDSSKRGVWSLTEKGINSELTYKKALEMFKSIQQEYLPNNVKKTSNDDQKELLSDEEQVAPEEDIVTKTIDYRQELLEIMRKLSPTGFENLCQEFLRESGFQKVEVTGKSGDGGIDGKGILQINPLISIPVLFQCKRYTGSVGSPQIRDFRGAMMGRADKGIFITTGNFTIDAQREAVRDGVSPIELVDADKLIKMFENLEFGLKSVKTYKINHDFFERFR